MPISVIIYLGVDITFPVSEWEPILVVLHLPTLATTYTYWWFYSYWSIAPHGVFGKTEYGFKKKWLSVKEFPRYVKLLVLIMPTVIVEPKAFNELSRRIIRMWSLTGTRFTILYWAEVYRVTLNFLNGKGAKDPKFCPKLTKRGIPKVYPLEIRKFLWEFRNAIRDVGNLERVDKPIRTQVTSGDSLRGFILVGVFQQTVRKYYYDIIKGELTFKLLSSILCFFRACCPDAKVRVNYDSIQKPFSGVSSTLDADRILFSLRSMGVTPLRTKVPKLLRASSKAGPNGTNAIMSMGLDLIAWIRRPHQWLKYMKMSYQLGYYRLCLWFLISSLLLVPAAIISALLSMDLFLGRLAILPEARGKMRKIGITDWWTQTLFKPLHDEIYRQLTTIPQDGTAHQTLPVMNLLQTVDWNDPEASLESVDLSDATDRLPIDVQVQVLNCLGFPGDLWRDLLDRDWLTPEGGIVRYAVGQPMGAYSSFAMLALTQHVLMHMAAINARRVINPSHLPEELIPSSIKLRHGPRYSVLGDDSALDNLEISTCYVNLLNHLGVVVSPIKGFSGNVCEFAKQIFVCYPAVMAGVKGKYGANLSPLGAKNVLLAIRYPLFLTSLIMDMTNKEYKPWDFLEFDHIVVLLLNLFPGHYLKLLRFGKVPSNHVTLAKAYRERKDWVFGIIITCFGCFSGLWTLNKNIDTLPLTLWSEKIFLMGLAKLGVHLDSNRVFILLKHAIIKSSKRSSWVKNLKVVLDGEMWKNTLWALFLKPVTWRLYMVDSFSRIFSPIFALGVSFSTNPYSILGVVPYGAPTRKSANVWLPNTGKLIVFVDVIVSGVMALAAILSLQWMIVLADLLRKTVKQIKVSASWLLSDLVGGDFAKVGFQGYARDDMVKYVRSTQIHSSKDPVVKYRVTTKGGPIKYSSIYGDDCDWGAAKFAAFIQLIAGTEPIENLATKSFRDYRDESLSAAYTKTLRMFMPFSHRVQVLFTGTIIARDQLKKHLGKSRVMPAKARLVRLLGAPTKKYNRRRAHKRL